MMSENGKRIGMEPTNIQGNIYPGFNCDYEVHILINFKDLIHASSFLEKIRPSISSTAEILDSRRKLRQNKDGRDDLLNKFFFLNVAIGLESYHALIDSKEKKRLNEVNLFLTAGANRLDALLHKIAHHLGMLKSLAQIAYLKKGRRIKRDKQYYEHFGYRDGISQPSIKWLEPDSKKDLVNPGEFIFGLPTEKSDGKTVYRRFLGPKWSEGGSLLTFLELKQDVKGFKAYTKRVTELLNKRYPSENITKKWFEAMLMGRWPDGSLVDDCTTDSPDSKTCPFASHVKRSIIDDGYPKSNRHRILRRGIPYGSLQDSHAEKGLLFVCYQTSIKQQFDHVYRNMANIMERSGADPFTANLMGTRKTVPFVLPIKTRDGHRKEVYLNVPQLVSLEAGGHFFVPSLSAIDKIAAELSEENN